MDFVGSLRLLHKWTEAFALSDQQADQQADTVARTLVNDVISRHGVPHTLHSDQGRIFEGKVIAELCQILEI